MSPSSDDRAGWENGTHSVAFNFKDKGLIERLNHREWESKSFFASH